MYERCTQLTSDWHNNSWCQYRTLQTAQHCINSRYLHPEKAPPLSLSNGVNTHWWNGHIAVHVDSRPQHVAEHKMTAKKKKKRQNYPIKYSQRVAPDLGPSLATALIIITPILPFICPARRSVVVSAHSPDVAQNRPECSFLVLFGEGLKEAQDL